MVNTGKEAIGNRQRVIQIIILFTLYSSIHSQIAILLNCLICILYSLAHQLIIEFANLYFIITLSNYHIITFEFIVPVPDYTMVCHPTYLILPDYRF